MKTQRQQIINPFWIKSKESAPDKNPYLKQISRWSKIIVYAFFAVMGLWGCGQQFFDYSIALKPGIGQGMEICGLTAGDPCLNGHVLINDGGTWYDSSYYVISNWGSAFSYGPFYGIFVFPFAWLSVSLMYTMRGLPLGFNGIITIIVIVLIIRSITLLFNWKSITMTQKMQQLSGKIAEINAKYAGKKDRISMQQKQLETFTLYKRNNIKTASAFSSFFITAPFFYTMYRIIGNSNLIKKTTIFGNWNMSDNAIQTLFGDFSQYWSLIFLILVSIGIQITSAKLVTWMQKLENRKKGIFQRNKSKGGMTQNIMVIAFVIASLSMSVGINIYWSFSGLFTICQTLFVKKYFARKHIRVR